MWLFDRIHRSTILLSAVAIWAVPAIALSAEPAAEHDHTHVAVIGPNHPENAAAASAMQNMQAMHDKMMAAKTPAERQALMADHMKAMQVGMSAMQQMSACCGSHGSSKSMAMRMDMMTMMMQMMMDRQSMMGGSGMGGMMNGSANPPAAPGTSKP